MSKVIVYIQNNGIPAVIYPTDETLASHSIDQIALKDVPAGKPYKIVDTTQLPSDVPQEAWIIDEADLTDGIGGKSNVFS